MNNQNKESNVTHFENTANHINNANNKYVQ